MPDAAETLVTILEKVMQSHTQIAESLLRMEERQHEHNLALAQLIGQNTASLAQILERVDARTAATDARIAELDARIAADSRALAEILERVVKTTDRTEQMTARILTELSSRGGSH